MRLFSVGLFLAAAALCLVGQVALIRSLIAGRSPGVAATRASRLAELAWIALPAMALGLVLFATWRLIAAQGEAPILTPVV